MGGIEDFLKVATPKTSTVKVCPRGDLLGLHEQLEEALGAALVRDQVENEHPQAPVLAQQIRDLEADIDASGMEFVFTALGRKGWSDLLGKHQPSDEQREEGFQYDPETFPPAAVAASCSSPAMTPEQVEQLAEVLNDGQWSILWGGCLQANLDGRDPFSPAAFAVLHGTETKPEQPGT